MKKFYLCIICIFTTAQLYSQGVDKPQYQIVTHRAGSYLGTFQIELFPSIAPLHVNNFDSLVNQQFYDSTAFHRVVPGFVIQGGDPNSISGPISTWGQGQPWQPTVPAEFNPVSHVRGILGAARDTDPNSANSQFYICVANATFLDNNYTVYGRVISGMDVVDTIVTSPRNANDVPLQKIEMFITYVGADTTAPSPVTLLSPADGATGILNNQNFTWSTVSDAVMYTIEMSTDPSFNTIDLTSRAGAGSGTVPGMQGSTTYYWRVQSNNGGHETPSTNVFSFTTTTGAATGIYPQDSSTNIPMSLIFQWDSVPNATSYTLQVARAYNFSPFTLVYNTSGLTDTTQIVSGLDPNKTYYWRVRSASGATQGFYSPIYVFTTGTSTSVEDVSAVATLKVTPNPVQNELMVELPESLSASFVMKIYDASGKLVRSSNYSNYNKTIRLDVAALPRGYYVLHLNSKESSWQSSFVKQ